MLLVLFTQLKEALARTRGKDRVVWVGRESVITMITRLLFSLVNTRHSVSLNGGCSAFSLRDERRLGPK